MAGFRGLLYTLAKLMGTTTQSRKARSVNGWGAERRGRLPAPPCGSCSNRLKVTVVGDPSQRPINGFYGLTS